MTSFPFKYPIRGEYGLRLKVKLKNR